MQARIAARLLQVAWLLSFGDEARLLGPDWLVERVKEQVTQMERNYEF